MAEPRDERHERHGRRHAEIGDHLAIVSKRPRDDAVERAEQQHERLPRGVALGTEDERRRPDERSDEREPVLAVKGAEGDGDEQDGRAPKEQLALREGAEKLFDGLHSDLKKGHPRHIFQDLTMRQRMPLHSLPGGRFSFFYDDSKAAFKSQAFCAPFSGARANGWCRLSARCVFGVERSFVKAF